MKNKIKLGWIGSGFVSQVAHLSSFTNIPNVEIVALSEIRKNLGRLNCKRFGIKKFYNSFIEMLNKEKLDGVVCIVRRYQTYMVAKEVLKKKINLFTEKPMAPTVKQAKHLVNLAKKNKLIYTVGNMRRHDSGVVKCKKLFSNLIKTKKIGNFLQYKHTILAGGDYCNIDGYIPTSEKISKKRFYPDSPDWLPKKFEKEYEKFLNYFNHNINLLRFFFDEINEIKYQNYINQNGNFFFNHKKFRGSFDFFYLTNNSWKENLEFIFSEGSINLELPPAFIKNKPAKIKIYSNKEKKLINHIPNFDWSFKNQAIDFVNSLKKNRHSISSGLDSLEDIRTIDKIWKKKFFSS